MVEAGRFFLQFVGKSDRPLLAGDVARESFDHQHRALGVLAELAHQPVRALGARRLVVRADVEGDLDAGLGGDRRIEVVVEVDHRHLHLVGLLQARQQVGRADRGGDHRRRLLLQHGVAGVELRLGGLVGLDRLQIDVDAFLLAGGVDALLHRAPEGVRQRLHQDPIGRLLGGEGGRRRKGETERGDRGRRQTMFQHFLPPTVFDAISGPPPRL